MTLGTFRTIATALVVTVSAASPALAQRDPTLSDIAGCNEQAAARTTGSALPHPGSPTPDPKRGAQRGESTPGIVPGPTDPGVGKAPAAKPPMPGTGGPGEKSDPSGSVITESPDPLVKGMDAAKADDPQYRAAYRDCMRGKIGGR